MAKIVTKCGSSVKKPPPTKPKPNRNNNNGNGNSNGDNKEPVQVFCRLRPLKNPSDLIVVKKINDNLLEITPPISKAQIYKFKHIFDDKSTQRQIFDQCAYPLIKDLLHGQNGIIFSYGVTSSGKTHTITGTPQDPGLLPRTLDTIFNTLDKNKLQTRRHIFKPDGQNNFEIISTPDAILKLQKESAATTPLKNFRLNSRMGGTTTPQSSSRKRTLFDIEWENRLQEDLFIKDINCDNNYAVFVSYIEVYNNYIYDLLDDHSFDQINDNGIRQPITKRVVEDNRKRMYIQNCKEIEVKNSMEAFNLCIKGMSRRRIGQTKLNNESSRSHSVFSIRIVQAPLDMEGVEILPDRSLLHISQLSIVDLAGCERTNRTKTTGNTLKEACSINNSLLTLRNCLDILRENQKFNTNKIVPYRESKLTHLFKNYFEGDGKVEMIICINPGLEDCEETLQVLKFAELSQDVQTTRGNGFINNPLQMKFNSINDFITMQSIFKIGPDLPNLSTDRLAENIDNDLDLEEFCRLLEKHEKDFDYNYQIMVEKQKCFRHELTELERDNGLIKQQNSTLKMDLDARETQIKEFENKLIHLQREYDNKLEYLEKSNLEYINNLEINLQKQEQQNSDLKNRLIILETNHKKYKKSIKERWQKEGERLQKYYLKKIEELEQENKSEKEKIDIVKRILSNENCEIVNRPQWLSPPPLTTKPKPHTTTTTADDGNNGATTTIVRGPPVINPGFRRSLSDDDCKWIDHRPPGTLKLGTIFQPQIKSKNKQIVSELKASDFLNNKNKNNGGNGSSNGGKTASKYSLIHHQATTIGTVETQVFKGQVIPSCTGGAQIIFEDVETLVQSPPPAKQMKL